VSCSVTHVCKKHLTQFCKGSASSPVTLYRGEFPELGQILGGGNAHYQDDILPHGRAMAQWITDRFVALGGDGHHHEDGAGERDVAAGIEEKRHRYWIPRSVIVISDSVNDFRNVINATFINISHLRYMKKKLCAKFSSICVDPITHQWCQDKYKMVVGESGKVDVTTYATNFLKL